MLIRVLQGRASALGSGVDVILLFLPPTDPSLHFLTVRSIENRLSKRLTSGLMVLPGFNALPRSQQSHNIRMHVPRWT
jgi:hypothetical protein